MKKLIAAVLAFAILAVASIILYLNFWRSTPATRVANRLVQLINASDYSGVESLFNQDMSQGLPLDKATEFFQGLTAQAGRIQKLDKPEQNSNGMVFPARCEHGVLDMTIALDDQNKIARLLFQPHVDGRTVKIANHLVELINAGDYSGVEGLFNKEMSQTLSLEKATAFFKGLSDQSGEIRKLDDPEPGLEGMVFPTHCEQGMLDMMLALDDQGKIASLLFKPPADRTVKVANHLVELINTADYSGVESLFNKDMAQALPLEKATEFLQGLIDQAGKIQNLDEPERTSEGTIFTAHCERHLLDMTLALDDQSQIAGLVFKPHVDRRYSRAANHLVELINASDYSGVEGLFNPEMSRALPLDKATAFFRGLSAQAGRIQKLDDPEPSSGGMVFPARCERRALDMTLILDGQNKIAGLLFKPHHSTPPQENP